MKIDDKLSQVFDMEVVKEGEVITSDGEVILPEESMEDYDFEEIRKNLHELLRYGKEGLEFALNITRESESPNALEKFTSLLGQLNAINLSLLVAHEKRKKIGSFKKEEKQEIKTVNNNNVFVGSSKDLNKFIKEMRDNGTTDSE